MSKVTIIIPSYNHADFLKDRLDCILQQTFTDWELIIIDDKSTDGSIEILTDFVRKNQKKVKHFIVNETNSKSGYSSWEKGIQLAESEYIWIAETDDYSDLNFLTQNINLLEQNKECALSFSASNYVDENKNFISNTDKRTASLKVDFDNHKVFKGTVFIDKMPLDTYINNGSSVVFRKPSIKIPDVLFESRQCSDLFLWTFLLKDASFIFINKKMNFFRRHENSTTTKITSSKAMIGTYKEVIRYIEYFNYPEKKYYIIEHYFNNYIWKNKMEAFNFDVFENNKILKKIYLQKIFSLTLKNIINGN